MPWKREGCGCSLVPYYPSFTCTKSGSINSRGRESAGPIHKYLSRSDEERWILADDWDPGLGGFRRFNSVRVDGKGLR